MANDCYVACLFGFLTSSSTTRLYSGRAPRQSVWNFYVLPHMRQSWETMTSVSAGHIILTPTQPVGSGRPQRGSNPGPPHQELRALPTELPPPPPPLMLQITHLKVLKFITVSFPQFSTCTKCVKLSQFDQKISYFKLIVWLYDKMRWYSVHVDPRKSQICRVIKKKRERKRVWLTLRYSKHSAALSSLHYTVTFSNA